MMNVFGWSAFEVTDGVLVIAAMGFALSGQGAGVRSDWTK